MMHIYTNTASDILHDATDLVNEFFSIPISREHHKSLASWVKSMKQIDPFSRVCHL